jgi:hypothetical protein
MIAGYLEAFGHEKVNTTTAKIDMRTSIAV